MAKKSNVLKSLKDISIVAPEKIDETVSEKSIKSNVTNEEKSVKVNTVLSEKSTNIRDDFCPLKVIPKVIYDVFESEGFSQETTIFGGEKKNIEVPILLFKPPNYHVGGIFSAVDKSFQFGSFFIGLFDSDILKKYREQLDYIKQKREKKEKVDIDVTIIYPSFDKIGYDIKFTKNYHPRFYIIPRSEMTPGKNINFPAQYGMSHSYLNIIRDTVFVSHFKKLRIKYGIDRPEFNSLQQHLFQQAEFNYIDKTNNIRWYKTRGDKLYAIDVTKSTNDVSSEYYGVGTITDQHLVWKDNVQKKLLSSAKKIVSKIINEC